MAHITQNQQHWHIEGNIVFNVASRLLTESKHFQYVPMPIVDFSKVNAVDTSAVSLMLEWQRRAMAAKSSIKFINLPESLISLTHLYGVTAFV